MTQIRFSCIRSNLNEILVFECPFNFVRRPFSFFFFHFFYNGTSSFFELYYLEQRYRVATESLFRLVVSRPARGKIMLKTEKGVEDGNCLAFVVPFVAQGFTTFIQEELYGAPIGLGYFKRRGWSICYIIPRHIVICDCFTVSATSKLENDGFFKLMKTNRELSLTLHESRNMF